ncbi:MAG: hypothetical protein JWQ03_654 [Variovorax sp.]|nr:hypothetical protein [Variovorax sp.]
MLRAAAIAALFAALAGTAQAQAIFTCTDSKGRRITADRPILDCNDRDQFELNPNGGARRRIAPTPTAAERAAEEQQAARQAEERARALDEKKRERALLTRYPDRASHDKERDAALAKADAMKAASQKRTTELLAQRKTLEAEVEFYKANPARTPPKLKHQVDDLHAQLLAQQRFLADQEGEKARVNDRFDQELSRLKLLWAQQAPQATVARAASASPTQAPPSAKPTP